MPRLRALRESLTCHRAGPDFPGAFELGADAALRAGNFGEWLKAASSLLHSIYPAMTAAAQASVAERQ